jgi:hypothetical protein
MSGRGERAAQKYALKQERKSKNYDRNMAVYARGMSSLPAEYLTVHQPSDSERVEKIKAKAQARRDRRSGKSTNA